MSATRNEVKIKVWGDMACFTRPEMKAERVSYDVMTPSAARGILEAIYWKPQIKWAIDHIHVLNPICFTNVRRNELGGRGPSSSYLKSRMDGSNHELLSQVIEDDRQQRASTILRNVAYLIKAHFEILDPSEAAPKHYEMFKRRANKGQCFHHPYLGCREFAADFCWHEGEDPDIDPANLGERDLGWMLYDFDFGSSINPRYYRPVMINGIVKVPPPNSKEVIQ